jgi:glucose/arabinose dehydrogenase
MMFYTGDLFPDWRGDLFIGAMRAGTGRFLVRLELEGELVAAEEHLLVDREQRIRDIRQAPDGAVSVITDSGQLLRLTPPSEG